MTSIDQTLSLYIPRVTRRMTAKFIAETIETMRIGKVDRVDLAETADKRQMTAYVHFSKWAETSETIHLQQRIKDPKQQARLVYDAPWYWILLVNNNPVPEKKEVVAKQSPAAPPRKEMVSTITVQNTFAAVLRGTAVRPPPPVSILQPTPPPTEEDISVMTQMAMDCDAEWNENESSFRANQKKSAERSSAEMVNEELLVIIDDLQSRLARCEQMIVNSTTRTENTSDAVSYLVSSNFRITNHINSVDARLTDVEYEMWPDEAAEVSDMEE